MHPVDTDNPSACCSGERVFQKARESDTPLGKLWYSANQQDVYIYKFYKWLDTVGSGGPWGRLSLAQLSEAAPMQGKTELLDRHEQHTVNCSVCSGALAGFMTAQRVARAAAAVLLLSAVVRSLSGP